MCIYDGGNNSQNMTGKVPCLVNFKILKGHLEGVDVGRTIKATFQGYGVIFLLLLRHNSQESRPFAIKGSVNHLLVYISLKDGCDGMVKVVYLVSL